MLNFQPTVKQIEYKKATLSGFYYNDSFKIFGAGYRNRTDDLRITSALLYHLS